VPRLAFASAVVCKAAVIGSCYLQYLLICRAPVTAAEAAANDARQFFVTRTTLLVALVALLFFLVWIRKAKKAEIELGMKDIEFSPGLSVGCFFIPFANFVFPFQSLRELWKGSVNPLDWKSQKTPSLVGWWWGLWLAYSIFPWVVSLQSKADVSIAGLKTTTILLMISSALAIAAFTASLMLIQKISSNIERFAFHNIGQEKPNQALLPTPTAVTPPASHESRQP
jgi:hypothetical protein